MRPVTTVALAAALLPAAAASAGPVRVAVLVVQPHDAPHAMPFRTVEDRIYRITVTGHYLYDGRFGRADCGHRDPPEHTPWISYPNFTVDRVTAQCVFQPFSDVHTYEWTQRGTGAPFVFDIPGGAYNTEDDLGPLLVVVRDGP